jgi:hypothetical protein
MADDKNTPEPSPLGVAPGTAQPPAPVTDPPDDSVTDPNDGVDFADLSDDELRTQLKATKAALTQANAQAKKYRLAGAKPKPPPAPKAPTGEVTDEVLTEVRTSTRAEVENTYKPALIRAAAEAAFISAGVSLPQEKDQRKAKIRALLRNVDQDELTVGDDGELEGLEDQIETLKVIMPEVFRAVRPKAPRIDGADKGAGREKAKSPTEQIADMIFGAR